MNQLPHNMKKNEQFFSFMNETFELFESYVKMNQKIIARFQVLKEVGKSFEIDFMNKENETISSKSMKQEENVEGMNYEMDTLREQTAMNLSHEEIYNNEQQNEVQFSFKSEDENRDEDFCQEIDEDRVDSVSKRFVYNNEGGYVNIPNDDENYEDNGQIYSETDDFFDTPENKSLFNTNNEQDYSNQEFINDYNDQNTSQNATIYSNNSSQNTETKQYQYFCPECGKGFMKAGELKSHSKVHSDERPFACTVCHQSFKQVSHLKRHERIHTGERPFVCTICDKAYTRSDRLKDHMKSHTEEYPCHLCNKVFPKQSLLNDHKKTHSWSTVGLNSSSHI